jgi:hypothetical protein
MSEGKLGPLRSRTATPIKMTAWSRLYTELSATQIVIQGHRLHVRT